METYITRKENDQLFIFHNEQKIGQSSPEAIWVKEGDEFEEYEVKLFQRRGRKYLIKGPCGHFH